ncbi:MAG TPA: carbohydrate ABC transporter permease [Burkholderiaceae bacterium]|jgi:ABC-type glycerol-3-phosphate transport system permease component|nr:carbohydrate ABC transporter permease [Burkholderiaceae bacterium]
MKVFDLIRSALAWLTLLLVTFLMCFPLIWAMSTSVKPPKDVMATPPRVIPQEFTIENYRNLITGKQQYFRADQAYVPTTSAPQHFTSWFANSVIVSVGSTAISIVISTLAAYSVTRFRYRGRRIIPYFSLLGYMIPSIILVFPMFMVMSELRLTNTLWSLTFGYVSITLPFSMWLLWAFFRGIPVELEEAAMIDGASRLRVFIDIVLPSALPGIIAAAIFSLIVSWNDFLFARVFINSIENLPLTVGVMHFFEGVHVDWGLMMASAVLMTVPMAVLFMLMQRHLVAGFGAGAVKG